MFQAYHTSSEEYYYECISSTQEYYTILTTIIHCRLAIQINHGKDTDEEIPGICTTVNTIESCMNILDCMTMEEIKIAIIDDEHLDMLSELVLHSWPSAKTEIQKELQP